MKKKVNINEETAMFDLVQVRARNGAGWGEWSNYIYVATRDEVKPTPLALRQNMANQTCIGFSWAAPPEHMGPVSKYKVQHTKSEDVFCKRS